MATRSSGALIVGERIAGATNLYGANPTSGALTLVAKVALNLDGIIFDTAIPPKFALKGSRILKTTKKSVTLRGTASSLLPLTVTARRKKAKVTNGKWTLKVTVKEGRNSILLVCADGMKQSKKLKVVVTRK